MVRSLDPESAQYMGQKDYLDVYNNILKKCFQLQKKLYYEACFEKYKHDMRKTWQTINEVLDKTRKRKTFPEYFKNENEEITDKLEIANRFNSFFVNIGKKLAKKIINPENCYFTDYLKRKITTELKFTNVNKETVIQIIDKLKQKTSCGFDDISTKLVKQIKLIMVEPLTAIINQMLNTGIFPDLLKISPIYKKYDETEFSNYRPISLPAISKIFETAISTQTYEYFTTQKLFYKSQY